MNYVSTRDLKNAVLTNCGENTDGSSECEERVLQYLNKGYLAVHAGSSVFNVAVGDAWVWAKAQNPGILILKPPVQTGTIAFTVDSDAAVFSVIPTTSLQGWYVKADGDSEWYQIITHNAGEANFQLDSAYLESTGSKEYTAICTDYEVNPGVKIMRLIAPLIVDQQQFDNNGKIYSMTEAKMMEKFPRQRIRQRVPEYFCRYFEFDGVTRIRFNSFVASRMRVRYDYVPVPNDLVDSDSDIPKIPREFREFLENLASYKLLLDKEDDRANAYLSMANAGLQALSIAERKEDSAPSQDRGRLIPRRNTHRTGRRYV